MRSGRACLITSALFVGCAASSLPGPPPSPQTDVNASADAGDPGQPVIDTTGWARATDSAFAAAPRWHRQSDGQCIADLGCPAPANIPSCPQQITASPNAFVERAQEQLGRMLVRGQLRTHGSITAMDCNNSGCCNHAGGALTIGALRLVDRRLEHAFRCRGDDSILCCGFELPEQDVLVAGRLTGNGNDQELEDVAMCALRPVEEEPPRAKFDAEGCAVDGDAHRWGQPFGASKGICACYGGRIYCRREQQCFRAGQWFKYWQSRPLSSQCAQCTCGDGWSCALRPCAMASFTFPIGSAKLDPRVAREWERLTRHPRPVRFEVRGFGDVSEGDRAMALSRKRAHAVAQLAERSGVPSARIEERALGTLDLEPKLDRSVREKKPGRVEIVVWDLELTQPPEPRPPQ